MADVSCALARRGTYRFSIDVVERADMAIACTEVQHGSTAAKGMAEAGLRIHMREPRFRQP
jgi:hypothetical protein